MSYGPGYTMWKQILREREERRLARQQAKRTITPPQEPETPARKRSKNRAGAAAEIVPGSNPPTSRAARRPSTTRGMNASAEAAGRRAARSAAR
ncbi:MAG TPA: hypothetical protein VFY87_02850 [Geminicoccaceae bacterium]|nr:hypothetical protein [Geminicoccaceae bacterium]